MDINKIKAVVFDCDGVIIDSGADIAEAVNKSLEHFGMECLPETQIISYIGNGARTLVEKSVIASKGANKIPPCDLDVILTWYKKYYGTHAVVHTSLYPRYKELLDTLDATGRQKAVLSNKPLSITKRILAHFEIDKRFDTVLGPETLHHIKPNPEGLMLAAAAINEISRKKINADIWNPIEPSQVLMVGDSYVDIQTGRNFGCRTCAVTGGMGNKELLEAEHADITVFYASDLIDMLS